MNIETVNELIQSLESAGELSIKERKYLELAREFKQLAAENVELKSFGGTLHEIKSSLVGGGHGHMAKADMQAQSAVMDVIFDAFDAIETPATDRIVAAQRSAFVDEAVAKITESGVLTFGDCIVALCQLREGAVK
ncbi:hypothetical protein [Klebsiella michiganensis]|uniref:hypothetical protein n=1 Tax=Klebsiella michiganensis TaxID=1134687 RepID=UPI003B252478